MADPAITNHVRKAFPKLSDLFDAGEACVELMASPGWTVIQRVLKAEIADADVKLEAHEPLSRAKYAQITGRRAGLRAASETAATIARLAHEAYEEQQAKHESGAEPE